jgi:hypothetical protein
MRCIRGVRREDWEGDKEEEETKLGLEAPGRAEEEVVEGEVGVEREAVTHDSHRLLKTGYQTVYVFVPVRDINKQTWLSKWLLLVEDEEGWWQVERYDEEAKMSKIFKSPGPEARSLGEQGMRDA